MRTFVAFFLCDLTFFSKLFGDISVFAGFGGDLQDSAEQHNQQLQDHQHSRTRHHQVQERTRQQEQERRKEKQERERLTE